jgi:hypothetical protein
MAIDLIALKRASDGSPEQLVAVRRKLLQDAYHAITCNDAEGAEAASAEAPTEEASQTKAKASKATA